MSADLVPHLGPQARMLLDRIVAGGAAGVDGRDTDDWVLSRLIELRYVEQSSLDDWAFVSTAAGRHRWQIEILADEARGATALRRQLIRHRLDERFTRLGIGASTALTTAACSPAEPRLHGGMPGLWGPPPRTKVRLSSVLTLVCPAAAVALVVISANFQPQEIRDWLFPPTLHIAVVPEDQPKANAEQTVPVGTSAVAAPVNLRTEEAEAAPARTQRAASIDTIAPSQDVAVANGTVAPVEEVGHEGSVVVDAAPPDGRAILSSAVTAAALIKAAMSESGHVATDLATGAERGLRSTAAALIDSAVSKSGQIATDVTAGVGRGFKSITAVLLGALAAIERTDSTRDAEIQQGRDDVPAPVALATKPQSEHEQLAVFQPAFASYTETELTPAAFAHATPSEGVTAKGPAARGRGANVDPQHAAVERLNGLSLAAARRGEAWRPDGLGGVAATGRRP